MIFLLGLSAFIFTLLGGLFALKFKDKLHLILGFSAGAVIGVAFFDLIPEALKLGSAYFNISTITSLIAVGFIGYMILDRFIILHSHDDEEHTHHNTSKLGAGSLSVHSFIDGIAIGLAFQVSSSVGLIVAIAVLVHDFSDGINTVNFVLKDKGEGKLAFRWLLIDALAPVLGVCSTFFFTFPQSILAVVLALFAGFFLYIGASDLLPESHHNHPRTLTTCMTILGVVVLYVAITLVSF
jgi:ZIP family zinc transporter